MTEKMLARVAVSSVPYAADRLYTYLVPDELIGSAEAGKRVMIPFGRGNRRVEGFLLEVGREAATSPLKPIDAVLDDAPLLDAKDIRLVRWMKARYFCTYYDAIKTILPGGVWLQYRELWHVNGEISAEDALSSVAPDSLEETLLRAMLSAKEIERAALDELGGEKTAKALHSLEACGLAVRETKLRQRLQDKSVRMVSLCVSAEDALAAVGATTTLSNLIIGFLLGLANGFAIITAQRFGAKDIRSVKKSFAASLVLGTVISVVLTVLGLVFLQPILRFLNVPEHLIPVAGPYIFIIIAGLLATFLYDACAAALRALGDTVTPLVILAVSVALNIAGDLLFVLVLKAGVRGAAAATVLAQILAFVICWLYMLRRYEMLRLVREDFRDADTAMMKNMLGSGLSMGFMSSLVNIGSLTLQTAINKLGQDIIVAHTAARKISEIFMTMFSVFGQTMATYCGQNLGAGRIDRVKKGIRLGIFYTCIWCTLSAVASYTIGRWLVYLVTGSTNEVVILNATNYLKFDTLFYYVTAVICVLRNAMQGLGDHITPLISSSLEMVGKIVIAATLVPMLGYTGVIVAEPLVWFIMVIPLVVQIFRMPVLREENRGNQGK